MDRYRLMHNFTNMSNRQRAYLRTLVSKTAERLTPASQAETILKLYLSLKRNSGITRK